MSLGHGPHPVAPSFPATWWEHPAASLSERLRMEQVEGDRGFCISAPRPRPVGVVWPYSVSSNRIVCQCLEIRCPVR